LDPNRAPNFEVVARAGLELLVLDRHALEQDPGQLREVLEQDDVVAISSE
jgi:hypothetical protein